MSEILEEHLKDILWLSMSIIIGTTLFNSLNIIRVEFLDSFLKSVILVIEKYVELSAKYRCDLTISMPNISLIDYSILLNGNKYRIIIQGICISEGETNYSFKEVYLQPGAKYSIKKLENEVVFIRR